MPTDIIFEPTEMHFQRTRPTDSALLLAKEGTFFLEDVARVLGISSTLIKHHAQEIRAKNQSAYGVMVARKIWNHWIIQMKIFCLDKLQKTFNDGLLRRHFSDGHHNPEIEKIACVAP